MDGMTLDDYLVEVDRWKQPVSDRALSLPLPARAECDREARAWLEEQIGRPFGRAPEIVAAPARPAMPSGRPASGV